MSINSRVESALNGVVPFYFGSWKGATTPAQYAIYTTMSTPDTSADDETDCIKHFVYLNLSSPSSANHMAILASIHAAMEAAGFLWQEERAYDELDTQTTLVAMTWVYPEAI